MSIARELCKEQLEQLSQRVQTPTIEDLFQRAQTYALLDIADAIREHTAAVKPQTYTARKDHS